MSPRRNATSDPTPEQCASADLGHQVGRDTATQIRDLVFDARSRVAGDPVAEASLTTTLLHALVDNGKAKNLTHNSVAAGLKDTRARAIAQVKVTPIALAALLGIGETRAGTLLGPTPRATRR